MGEWIGATARLVCQREHGDGLGCVHGPEAMTREKPETTADWASAVARWNAPDWRGRPRMREYERR
ncbi:MAG: hypothetical protein HKL99_10445 [Burkholderiales bacterium]|nr:hypothetical protein [Burkholderiales bacterium]